MTEGFNVDPTLAALLGYRQSPFDDPVAGVQPVNQGVLTPAQMELFKNQYQAYEAPQLMRREPTNYWSTVQPHADVGRGLAHMITEPFADMYKHGKNLLIPPANPPLPSSADPEKMGTTWNVGEEHQYPGKVPSAPTRFDSGVGLTLAAAGVLPIPAARGATAAKPFYSAVEKAIEGAKIGKAPLAQWVNYLRGRPGVKEEELNWLGIGKNPAVPAPGTTAHNVAFDDPASVTRDELLNWAKQQGVQIRDVNKGSMSAAEKVRLDELDARVRAGENLPRADADEYMRLTDAESRPNITGRTTKYAKYQLPGGQNYREQLLTIPPKSFDEMFGPEKRYEISQLAGRHRTPEQESQFQQLQREMEQARGDVEMANYRSSHWDEPNILAHVRMNDRELLPAAPGGNPRKALFLEELQSDWHQAGRKQGYRGVNDHEKMFLGMPRSTVQGHEGVPNAPFKETWPDLALKRMIHRAADEGYDALAWTPGQVQADRYGLSKHVTNLKYEAGTGHLTAYRGTEPVFNQAGVKPDQLSNFIGEEAANKLLNSPSGKVETSSGATHYLDNQDLRMGGAGMRAFYDRMLVDKANALGKAHGAKVEQQPLVHIQEDGRGGWSVYESGIPIRSFDSRQEAQNFLGQRGTERAQKVHVLPITEALREAAKKGFPLFMLGGGALLGSEMTPEAQERVLRAIMSSVPGGA